MGLLNQLSRALKKMLNDFFGAFSGKKKRKRKLRSRRSEEPIEVPETWRKDTKEPRIIKDKKPIVVVKHKTRIPGLRLFHRILYGVMLLLNLVFSQFLLGSVGTGAQPMFLFFLLNAYCIFRLLWSFRKKE